MSVTPSGFLNLTDLKSIHEHDPIFTTPDGEGDDVTKQIDDQIKKTPGVALDIRLGDEFYLSGESYTCSSKTEQGVHIQPSQFALLTTFERFHVPNYLVAFISMRFGIKVEGLINVSGFQVDPGFNGVFTFSVYNAGPNEIHLEFKRKIFTVIFAKTSSSIGKSTRKMVTGINFDHWSQLRTSKKLSLIGLDERMSALERKIGLAKYLVPVVGIAVAVIVALLTFSGRSGN